MFRHKGKQTGILRDDNVYISYRYPKHYFRKYNGFGITLSLLKKLIETGCKKIVIIYRYDIGVWIKYTVMPKTWFDKGITYQYEDKELQSILNIKYFNGGKQNAQRNL